MKTNQYVLVRSTQKENLYGPFVMEILAAEGFMGFETLDLDQSPFPAFQPGDLIVLTRCALKEAEIEALYRSVEQGARLVCFQPSYRLAERFGLKSKIRVLHPGWVKISPDYPGAGLPIQTHAPMTLYEAPGWEPVAEAVDSEWTASGSPAAVRRSLGQGQAAFFFYDLPLSVARIRFGNPDLASYCTTGHFSWLHTVDLFVGHVDPRVAHLPQADFHGQLLAKVLSDVCAYPLPRFWYYPEAQHRTVAVFQSDGDFSTVEQFRRLSDSLLAHGGTATFYLLKRTRMTEDEVAALRAKGHTFAPHVNPYNSEEEWYFGFPEVLREETRGFRERFGECSPTIQCHCAPWQGYMDWVPAFRELGYRLLFAYLSAPTNLVNRFMVGSGRALRFFDLEGTLHDCWQQPIVCYDDTTIQILIEEKGLESFLEQCEPLVRQCVEQTHTTLGILSHPVSFSTYSWPYIERLLDLLQRERVPIYNGDQWCAHLDRRSALRMTQEARPGGWRCEVRGLRGKWPLMIPLGAGGQPHKVVVNGVPARGAVERRLGQDYLMVEIEGDGQPCVVEIGA